MQSSKTQLFIEKARLKHVISYDYSKVEYLTAKTKVIIGCVEHGDFLQTPMQHLTPSGCQLCSKLSTKRRGTTENFIQRAVIKHGDTYDYHKSDYVLSNKNITIICKLHGEFQQTPSNHLAGNGCPECAQLNRNNKLSKTTPDFINDAIEVHSDIFDYSKVEYVNSHTHVIIICKIHGEFSQSPSCHLSGKKCPKCYNKYYGKEKTPNFINKAKVMHGDTYDYSKVDYVNNSTHVTIICKTHGEFLQTPAGHLAGKSCIKCSGIDQKTTDWFITSAIKIQGDKYSYSKSDYIDSKTKVIIICKIHGEFLQTPGHHLSGQGCNKCNLIIKTKNQSKTTEKFILDAINVYGDKYDYSKVDYKNSWTYVVIICKIHGDFLQIPDGHLSNRNGCPMCNKCPSCQLWITNGRLCVYCKPKNKNKLYQKTKEYAVVNYLRDKLPNEYFIHNKSVGSDCTGTHLFPDVLLERNAYNVIVEIDEFKHRGASYKCDVQRMYNIIAKLGLPCIFIRYNPDSKSSNKEMLLKTLVKYLNIENNPKYTNVNAWDDFGFKAKYLFY